MARLQQPKLLSRVALILGSYAFSVTFSSLIHEIGHIIALYSIGITQIELVINPLTESRATPLVGIPNESLLYASASGMIFQFIFFTVLGLVLWRNRSTYMTPLLMCVPMSLLNIGSYLLLGGMFEGSDTVLMVDAGLPSYIIMIVGVVILVSGAYTFTRILSQVGLRSSDSITEIALPVLISMSLYGIAMSIYGYTSGYGTIIGLINLVSAPILTTVFTLVFKKTGPVDSIVEINQGSAVHVLAFGVASVALCLLLF